MFINFLSITYTIDNITDFIIKIKDMNMIVKISTFYLDLLLNVNLYFDNKIIIQILAYIDVILYLTKNNTQNINTINNLFEPIISKTIEFISTDLLNIHEKLNIFLKLCIIFDNENINFIPDNFIDNFINFNDSVPFNDWSNITELIDIYTNIGKVFFKADKYNKLFISKNIDQVLYILLDYENKIFTLIESYVKKTITFVNYNNSKTLIFDMISIINCYNYIQEKYIYCLLDNYDLKIFSDVLYKNNLILTKYLLFTDIPNYYKFNLNILLRNIIITKLSVIYIEIKNNKFVDYGLEFDKIINFYKIINCYNNTYINISSDFLDIMSNLIQEHNGKNKFIEKYEDSIFVDKLFYVEINDPYMLPNINDIYYERSLIRLVIRETKKNPMNRNNLTLLELDNYNNGEIILDKIKYFNDEKQKLL